MVTNSRIDKLLEGIKECDFELIIRDNFREVKSFKLAYWKIYLREETPSWHLKLRNKKKKIKKVV